MQQRAGPRTGFAGVVLRVRCPIRYDGDPTDLLDNGWLQLVAIEDDGYFRFTEQQTWDEIHAGALSARAC